MRTLQEKYNAVLEGNFSKEQFRRDAIMQLPNLVSKLNSFEDMSTILKNRGMLAEAKAQEPKYSTAKPEDTIAPDVLDTGIKFELDKKYGTLDVTDEQYAKCREMAIKNLAKDVLYYVKQDSIQLETPGEKMEKVKLNEETALDRAQDNAATKVQNALGDIADTVAEKPASVAAAFKKMVLTDPVKYAKMSAHELEQEFEKFKLEEATERVPANVKVSVPADYTGPVCIQATYAGNTWVLPSGGGPKEQNLASVEDAMDRLNKNHDHALSNHADAPIRFEIIPAGDKVPASAYPENRHLLTPDELGYDVDEAKALKETIKKIIAKVIEE